MLDLNRRKTREHIREIGIEAPRVPAFGYSDRLGDIRYDWHQHTYHQLLYSFSGAGQLEVGSTRYFLPPQCAAWISVGTMHRTTFVDASGGSVFFHPKMIRWRVASIRIIAAPPLLREMVKGAIRWPPHDKTPDPLRDLYFRTLALLSKEWLADELPFWLPQSDDPQLVRAIDYTLNHLAAVTADDASSAAAMSSRSFRRHFAESLGMSWRDYLVKARLLRAMEMLARPGTRVADVADEIGYESPSAFSKAFAEFASETPREYQRRVAPVQ